MPTAARYRPRRYPSDTTIAEWALLEPLLPIEASQIKTGGHPEKWPRRQIVDAIRYLVDNGTKWRALPADFPPWQTVYGFFARWNRAGVVTFIRDQLRRRIRTDKGRCPFPVNRPHAPPRAGWNLNPDGAQEDNEPVAEKPGPGSGCHQ